MRVTSAVVSFAVSAVLIGCQAPAAPPAGDPAGIEELVRTVFKTLDAGDRDGLIACLVDDGQAFPFLIYDMDMENKPIKLSGREASVSYLDSLLESIKSQDATVKSEIQ